MIAILVSLQRLRLSLVLLLLTVPALAKDTPLQVIDWPTDTSPVLRFTFSKFKQLDGSSSLHVYVMDIMAENLSARPISTAQFAVYLFDKNKVRISEDSITLTNLSSGETVKFQNTFTASGTPVSVSVQDTAQIPRTISLTVNSIPQGAMLRLDQTELGTTPRIINVGVGQHTLTFSKEGFTVGTYPLEISPQDVPGGSVDYELGASAFDSIELRDGSVLNGDFVSISGMDAEIRVGGTIQHIDRNKIKRVIFVQRGAFVPNLPAATTPSP
jgi:PEGA domain